MSGILIKIGPDGRKELHEYGARGTPKWEVLYGLVGGYIERVRVRYEGKLRDAYLNEEGLLKGLPINKYAHKLIQDAESNYAVQQYFVGPIVIWIPDKRVKKNV